MTADPPGALVAAVDVGGTSIKAALMDDRHATLRQARRRTPAEGGPEAVLNEVASVLAELVDGCAVSVAGVVVPGVVDEAHAMAVYSGNLGWRDLDIPGWLHAKTGLDIAFGHDVRAGALAEMVLGAAVGVDNLVFLPIGTGVAAAIVVDGRLLSGGGYVGEIGHLMVAPHGGSCVCGGHGCLETVASAGAIAARYHKAAGRPDNAATHADAVVDRLRTDDLVARAVWTCAVDALADVLAATTALVAPELIVIGGGLSQAGDLLLEPLRLGLAARLTVHRLPHVVGAALGDQAGCLGAGLLALDLARSQS